MTRPFGPSRRILSSPNYKWWAYFAIGVGMFLTVMDQFSLNIALPQIADHFSADIPTVQWLTLGYVLSTAAMFMPVGRLSDIYGRKRVYVVGTIIYVGAAALGGSAQAFVPLVVAKVIQGAGSAAIQANSMAMVAEVFPERERGRALGLYMIFIGAGYIGGPLLGGQLVTSLGWRSVFFASVPIGLVGLASAMVIFRGGRPALQGGLARPRFDWAGAGLSAAALTSLLLAMTNAYRLGWTSPPIIAGFALALALLAAFLWWELRAKDPMLELSFFRDSLFATGALARFLSFLGTALVFFLMPFYLVQGLGYQANKAGLLMVPGSLSVAVVGPIGGRLCDRFGPQGPAVAGLLLTASGLFTFSRLTLHSSPGHVVLGMILVGSGIGAFSSANTSAMMSTQGREKYGVISAFLNVNRTCADVIGIAIATTVVTLTMGSLGYEPSLATVSGAAGQGIRAAFVAGLNKSFLIAGSFALLGITVMVLRRRGRQVPGPALQQAHPSESAASTTTKN